MDQFPVEAFMLFVMGFGSLADTDPATGADAVDPPHLVDTPLKTTTAGDVATPGRLVHPPQMMRIAS